MYLKRIVRIAFIFVWHTLLNDLMKQTKYPFGRNTLYNYLENNLWGVDIPYRFLFKNAKFMCFNTLVQAHTVCTNHDVMKFVHFCVSHFRYSLLRLKSACIVFKLHNSVCWSVLHASFTYGNKNVYIVWHSSNFAKVLNYNSTNSLKNNS